MQRATITGILLLALGLLGIPKSPRAAPLLGAPGEAPGTTPRHLRLSLTKDPSRSITIAWDTLGDTESFVVYGIGQGGNLSTSAPAKASAYETSPYITHEVTIEGLAPNTTYAFRVGAEGSMSEARSFKTAPEPGTGSARFIVIGDSRNDFLEFNQDRWKDVADAAAAEPIDFSLHTGDYTLTSASPFGWEWFFDAGANLFAKAPFMAVRGNHEMYGPTFMERFAMPGNERYYSFDYGPVHVAVLDSEDRLFTRLASDVVSASDFGRGSEQYEWLKKDLESLPKAMWKVVALHRPPYSVGEHGDQVDVQALVPLFDSYGVNIVLAGHDHTYQRSKPMVAGKAAERGTVYVVSAGAGAPLYELGEADWLQTAVSAFHYVFVQATPETFRIEAKTPDGALLDTVDILR